MHAFLHTELIYFSRKRLQHKPTHTGAGEQVVSSENIKILDLKFDENLSWDVHFKTVRKKARIVFSKLKYLRSQ